VLTTIMSIARREQIWLRGRQTRLLTRMSDRGHSYSESELSPHSEPWLKASAAAQLRALMYVTSLTSEIMDSMVGVENAIESALERQTTFHPVKFYLRQKSAVYKRCDVDTSHIVWPQC